jgi:molybdopterin adenylyltransferase
LARAGGATRGAYLAHADDVILKPVAVHDHKERARANLRVGIITASDTRTRETDRSGNLIRELFEAAGHRVAYYEVMPDDPAMIAGAIVAALGELDALVVNGGTGITPRDSTVDAIRPLLDKELDGFGELFRMLSYQEIGAAAILSRAIAGTRHGRFIAALPGSTAACRLAMEKLIIPELGHIAYLLSQ